MALENQNECVSGHGLRFFEAADVFEASAQVLEGGTFSEYLQTMKAGDRTGNRYALHDVLSRIIEISPDYDSLGRGDSLVRAFTVDASVLGTVVLKCHIPADEIDEFRARWSELIPTLKDCCDLGPEGATLVVTDKVDISSYDAIARFCSERLEMGLLWTEAAKWFVVMPTEPRLVLPRPAYYLLAMFILGSIVRYTPESLISCAQADSELGWFLSRFLDAAERFYPQLMLRWAILEPVFF